MKRRERSFEPLIEDPATHPTRTVCLRVAADFLEIDQRTLKKRIRDGIIEPEFQDGNIYRFDVDELVRHKRTQRKFAQAS